jgi:hypothetical protein
MPSKNRTGSFQSLISSITSYSNRSFGSPLFYLTTFNLSFLTLLIALHYAGYDFQPEKIVISSIFSTKSYGPQQVAIFPSLDLSTGKPSNKRTESCETAKHSQTSHQKDPFTKKTCGE